MDKHHVSNLAVRILGDVEGSGPEPEPGLCSQLRFLDCALAERSMRTQALDTLLDVLLALDEAYRGAAGPLLSLREFRRANPDSIFMKNLPC